MQHKNTTEYFVIGATGLVGRSLTRHLSQKNKYWKGTYHHRPEKNLIKLDILQDDVYTALSDFKPSIVFHCANLSGGVNSCEKNPEVAKKFHLDATKNIGRYCKDRGATFVYLSTDYVFDGSQGEPYQEEDIPRTLNGYGRLKLQSERYIQENLKNFLIIRTTNVYGWDPYTLTPNYVMNVYRTLKEGKILHAPSYLFGTPTYVEDLVCASLELYQKKHTGIFHVVGDSFVNRFQWALESARILGLERSLIQELKQPLKNDVVRPLKSWLSNQKFKKQCRTELREYTKGLQAMKHVMEKDLL